MSRVRTLATAVGMGVLLVGWLVPSTAAASGGGGELRKLYREDALAGFVVHTDPTCDAARTEIQVSFHQDLSRVVPAPTTRGVQFGVSISSWDCGDQFLWRAEGVNAATVPFDIAPGLTTATADGTVAACVTFPAPGGCFDVQEHATFTGIGKITRTKHRTLIHDPDCIIDQRLVTRSRTARTSATIAFTPHGGTLQSYTFTNADLTADGATISSDSENTYMNGDGFNCTEH